MKSAGLQQLVEVDHAHPELRGPGWLHERVVGDQLHAKSTEPLSNQDTDAAKADNADDLVSQLDTGVLGALPFPSLQRSIGRTTLRAQASSNARRVRPPRRCSR